MRPELVDVLGAGAAVEVSDGNELILERWIPWEQVYGPDEESEDDL